MRARRGESKQLASQAAVNNKTLAEFKSGCLFYVMSEVLC